MIFIRWGLFDDIVVCSVVVSLLGLFICMFWYFIDCVSVMKLSLGRLVFWIMLLVLKLKIGVKFCRVV